eukprot:TRINITY_DN1195_c0_g1_i1.p1 TRINITY_DN1195_c0_g1~~TRINITY_DN1195_c0_g1_i1.p1  ORF type:complete len:182 (+),score=22.76 TRINITY_DN1195_c0_g1_i1:47-592(+)
MGGLISKLKQWLFSKKLELVIVGLENCGKTTFANHLTYGEPKKTLPTLGLNVRYAKKENLSMKIWDLGGQVQFRPEWACYAKSCDIIIFMIDASNRDTLPTSRKELHILLEDKEINGIPILVLANKIDIEPHVSDSDIIKGLNLDYVMENPWVVIPVSSLYGTNFDQVIQWLLKQSKRGKQ